ncbi:serine/threonine protein kinase [Slackia heliotrinireducens]|uniref:serine/threonine protein kinase n=1 Tax=Slackia heliotrinireducens TaxID=84110 RepID=UPI00331634CA
MDNQKIYAAQEHDDGRYRVEQVLSANAAETVQAVLPVRRDGSTGPLRIRKTMADVQGFGRAYDVLYEAQQRGLRYKYVPLIYEVEHEPGTTVVVMEFVEGRTLEQCVLSGTYDRERLQTVFLRLADALSELHEGFDPPIIHRDLQPGNIVITAKDMPVLVDFDVAREYASGVERDTNPFGMRGYAAPEQFGYAQSSVASDIYALGMVYAFCLLGRMPTQSDLADGFAQAQTTPAMRSVLAKATAFDPAKRFSSAAELKQAVSCALGGPGPAVPLKAALASAAEPELKPRSLFVSSLAMIWNALLALCVLVMSWILWLCIIGDDDPSGWPFWFRVVVYGFLAGGWMLCAFWALVDKHFLKKRFPKLRKLGFFLNLLLTGLVALVLFVVVIAIAALTGVVQP